MKNNLNLFFPKPRNEVPVQNIAHLLHRNRRTKPPGMSIEKLISQHNSQDSVLYIGGAVDLERTSLKKSQTNKGPYVYPTPQSVKRPNKIQLLSRPSSALMRMKLFTERQPKPNNYYLSRQFKVKRSSNPSNPSVLPSTRSTSTVTLQMPSQTQRNFESFKVEGWRVEED